MYLYNIRAALEQLEHIPDSGGSVLILLTSEELKQGAGVSGLEHILCHTPSAQDARVCKAESRYNCLCGTIVTPRHTKEHTPIAFGYLLTEGRVVLCDDTGTARSAIQHLRKETAQRELGIGGFFYGFLELLIAKDLHHLLGLEDHMSQMEEQVRGAGAVQYSDERLAQGNFQMDSVLYTAG